MKWAEGDAMSHDLHPDAAVEARFFRVGLQAGSIETRGQASAAFGHRIPSGAPAADDGIFADWHWDGTRLVVNNDRYGMYPLFWFRPSGGGVCVSPSLLTLIEQGAPAELDIEALAVFFRLGFFVGDDTPFSAIRTVPPHAVFEWQASGFECRARYPATPRVSSVSRDDAIDEYIDLFARAMAKRAPAPRTCAVPISGGRDSRHILLELHRTGHEPAVCVSALDNPPDPNEDPRIAALLCRELGFNFAVVDQQLSPFDAQLRKNRETHFCAAAHGWYLALADFMNGRFECSYDGIAGDVLSQSKFLNPELDAAFHTRDVATISGALLSMRTAGTHGLDELLKGALKPVLDRDLASNRLAREVEKHLDHPNPVGSFILWNRTRREIALAPYALLSGVPRVYAPFLDHDLFDFLSTLPSGMLLDHRFHDDTIARAYPDFAHVPYVDAAAPLPDDAGVRAAFLARAARRFLLKKPSRLTKNWLPRGKMLASILSGGRMTPWISPFIVYLDQIESIMAERR